MNYYVYSTRPAGHPDGAKGLEQARCFPSESPSAAVFSTGIDRLEARARLGLDFHKLYHTTDGAAAWLTAGIDEIIERLDRLDFDFQVMVVCGRNEKCIIRSRV
jgi:hypothetical protein